MAEGAWYDADIASVIITEEQIREKIAELAKQVSAERQRHMLVKFRGKEVLQDTQQPFGENQDDRVLMPIRWHPKPVIVQCLLFLTGPL